jgi:biotin-(acetyl-CoA carboxylase) ligase
VAGERIESLALGLGMNVNNPPAAGGVSLKDLLGQEVDRKTILRKWISNLDGFLVSGDIHGKRRTHLVHILHVGYRRFARHHDN